MFRVVNIKIKTPEKILIFLICKESKKTDEVKCLNHTLLNQDLKKVKVVLNRYGKPCEVSSINNYLRLMLVLYVMKSIYRRQRRLVILFLRLNKF